jgi:hypothetical protein
MAVRNPRRLVLVSWWLGLVCVVVTSASVMAQPRIVRVADGISPIRGGDSHHAVLLVQVMDHTGFTSDGATVSLRWSKGKGKPQEAKTDSQGRVRFELDTDGEIRVTATFVGFDISSAERVRVKVGSMTGVLLPMQVANVKEIISARSNNLLNGHAAK